MGIIDFVFRKRSEQNNTARLIGPGSYSTFIVGESYYQDELELICGRRTKESQQKIVNAVLIHENDNEANNIDIRVEIKGLTVGYLSAISARQYRDNLAKAGRSGVSATCSAMIVGGWDRGRGDKGDFGVRLDLPTL